MLQTKHIISELTEVPMVWPFEFYLNLPVKLTGQDEKIKSVFNKKDKVPSMFIYYSTAKKSYRYKDFSTSKGGDYINLVQEMFNLQTRWEAAHKVIEDYNQFLLTNKEDYQLREFKVYSKYKVVSCKAREWNTLDEKYWTKYSIGSDMLEKYCVKPLSEYTMSKTEDGKLKELTITGNHIYGYFKKDGSLYKIYQPMVKETKFIKVKDYIQGSEQLTGKVKYLIICSSLKDLMAFNRLGYKNVEAIAPDSENTMIPESVLRTYMNSYKGIATLFDNDAAGIQSMHKYHEKYGIKAIMLTNLSKDLSDSVRDVGVMKVRNVLTPILKIVFDIPTKPVEA